jgi:hypothetical protein
MAQKQDPPKKIMNGPKGTMTPPSRKKMLERVDKVIKKTVKPKNTLGAALARGAGRAMARGAVSAILPKIKIDSTRKVMPGNSSKPSFTIKKETKISRPTIGGSIPFPVRPEKTEKSKGIKGLYKK